MSAYKVGDFERAQEAFDTIMNSCGYGFDKLQAMFSAAHCREKRGDAAGAARIYRSIVDDFPRFRLALPGTGNGVDVREYAKARAEELAP